MSGPSLGKKHSHHAIHDGIFSEARDLTKVLKALLSENKLNEAKEISEALIEHWETRTLAHAQSEEEGFFVEIVKKDPDLKEMITKLKRDHQIIDMIVRTIKKEINDKGVTEEILPYFDALLVVFTIHNHEEETNLFISE